MILSAEEQGPSGSLTSHPKAGKLFFFNLFINAPTCVECDMHNMVLWTFFGVFAGAQSETPQPARRCSSHYLKMTAL